MSYNLIVHGMKGSISVENKTFSFGGKQQTGALFRISIPNSTQI
jgi:hypothetical protein